MSLLAERAVIRARILAQWGSTTEIAWDGFNGAEYQQTEGVAFIRPRVDAGEADFIAIAAPTRRFRQFATLVIDLNRPANEGDATGNAQADLLLAAFAGYSSGAVSFERRGSVIGPEVDGKFARWTVLLPYYREEAA